MVTAQFAKYAYLAIILTVAALVFPKNAGAASGNVQICQPGSSCTVGEFLYNDSYSPITTATCTITSRYPNGTLFLNAVNMPVSAEEDGWYAHNFTAPSTLGLYRTEIRCTTGGDTLALDKSFEIQTGSSETPSANDVATAVWGYSDRSLSTFGSLITDIWTNPTRTLSGFGTLVADIWASATRTLTGETLSSGSLAKQGDIDSAKDDISSVKTEINDVKKKVDGLVTSTTTTTTNNNVQNITNTTNNLLEQIINRPIIENGIEESSFTTTELQSKLEKSDSLANQLLTSGTYIKSKANSLKSRWNNLGEAEITTSLDQMRSVIGEENDSGDKNSIFGQLSWITEQWNLSVSSELYAQNKKLVLSLKNIKSTAQLKSLSLDLDNFIKLVGSSDDSPKSNTLFGQIKVQKELLSSLDKNYSEATVLVADIGKNSRPQTDLIGEINSLSIQVAAINQLPKMDKTILSQANAKMDQKQLKNKTLSLRGIVGANKQYLAQKPNEPLRSLWFEEGSIVFKTLISNPSKVVSQKVPLKYYLPKEVTRENIIKTDEELTVNYDSEKDQYFVSGNFTLDPGETKTLTVTVDDSAFYINDDEIAIMRKHAEELSKPLSKTAYFAQGVTLKSDIDASLDKMDSLQKNNITPEAKIRSYRESIIEFKAAKEKLEKLKELATNAGSVGTLFGFVGGAQVLAVWGLIIIMAAGFVFLGLYMRALRGNENYASANKFSPIDDSFENYEEVPNERRSSQSLPKKRFSEGKSIRYLAVLIISLLVGGSSVYALGNLRQGKINSQVTQTASQAKTEVNQAVLGSSDTSAENSYKEVNILVPDESTVTIFSQPSINSLVLTSLKASGKAKEVTRQDIWVKVVLQDSEGKSIEGWVDGDFVETEEKVQQQEAIAPKTSKTITVNDTPVGFLRVRQTPGGEELTKISPGEQFNFVKEQTGWVQIVLEDGTSGWVSKQYVSF